jgi:hypothetical protein
VDVTAHRRALWLRIGTVAAVAAGALAGTATPAFAAAKVDITVNPGTTNLTVGGSPQTIVITIKNSGDQTAQNVRATVDVPLSNQQVTISNKPDGCEQGSGNRLTCNVGDLNAGDSKNLSLTVSPPGQSNLQPGQSVSDTGTVSVDRPAATENLKITLKNAQSGPTQAAPVSEVSGTVRDSASGEFLAGATVVIQDGANNQGQGGTDKNGRFKFTSINGKPITAGTITISATKDGYDNPQPQNRQVAAGGKVTGLQINLKLTNASASPAAPESAADVPTSAPVGATDIANPGNKTANTSSFSWLFIILGGLLVLLGIGAIVLLLRRRGDDEGDDDEYDGGPQGPGGGGYRPAPADPTMVGSPMGAGMGATAVGGRGNANDATAIVNPVDPYAGPPNSRYDAPTTVGSAPGYGGASGYGGQNTAGFAAGGVNGSSPPGYGAAGYGAAGAAGYGAAGAGAAAGGYGAGAGGYGAGGGYADEPSAGYGPGGHSAGRDAYGADGYGANGAGGRDAYGADGYGANGAGPGGYGAGGPRAGDGGYGDDRTRGYEPGGYGAGDRGGYGPGGAGGSADHGGYGAGDRGGYGAGERGGYGAAGTGGYSDADDRGGYGAAGPGGYGAGERGGYGTGPGAPGGAGDRGSYSANGYGTNGAGPGGYGAGGPGGSAGYGSSGAPGYDDRGGYGDDRGRYDQGGYGAGGPGGAGGYGAGSGSPDAYGDRGGYGPSAGSGYDRDGYGRGPERGGYDNGRQGPPPRGADPGGRRSLDWLDD